MEQVLAFAPAFNTTHKSDATGAFQPEAKSFVRLRGGQVVLFDNRATYPRRAGTILDAIEDLDEDSDWTVAVFCHGLKNSLQAGFRLYGPVSEKKLVEALSRCKGTVNLLLYACRTGQVNGIASDIARGLGKGHRVYAHRTSGHTTQNPYKVVYEGTQEMVLYPEVGTAAWKTWRAKMKTEDRFFLDKA